MDSKYKDLSSPELYFKDNYMKSRMLRCWNGIFTQNGADISDDIYPHVLFERNDADAGNKSYFGVGAFTKSDPVNLLQDMRHRMAKGISVVPDSRFIFPNMDATINRFVRYTHVHAAFEHVVVGYVYEGEFALSINGQGFVLGKGNVFIISPGTDVSSIIDNDDTVVFTLMIRAGSFSTSFISLVTENNYASKFFLNMLCSKGRPLFTIVRSPPDDSLSGILHRLLELQESQRLSTAMYNSLAQLFICSLFYRYEDCIESKSAFDKNDILVADVLSYMHKNYSTTSLQDVSEQFSLSDKYLSRVMKEKAGMSYMTIMTDIKLNKAKELLKSTDQSIEGISSILGYSDSRQLRALFCRKFGVSPCKYRKENGPKDGPMNKTMNKTMNKN